MTAKTLAENPGRATDAAETYAEMGYAPIRIAKREKRPLDTGWTTQQIDPEAVDSWLAEGGNVGLRMGMQPDGRLLIALDEDEPGALATAERNLGALPETLTAKTGSGGQHRIFIWPSDAGPMPKGRVRALDGIDVRAEGGQIVVWPSIHPNGNAYDWLSTTDPVSLPEAWRDALAGAHPPQRTRTVRVGDPSFTASPQDITKMLAYVSTAPIAVAGDGGDERLYVTARECCMIVGPDEHAIETGLRQYNQRCEPPWTGPELDRLRYKAREAVKNHGPGDEWIRRVSGRRPPANTNGRSVGVQTEPVELNSYDQGHDPAVDNVIAHLADPSSGIFQRSGKLVYVTREALHDGEMIRPSGAPTIRELTPARLKEIIRTKVGYKDAAYAPEVLARGEWYDIRPLDAVVSYPTLRPDGTLMLASGYDPSTHTLANLEGMVTLPSEEPTQADARAALETLTDLVGDFPFEAEAQRAAWLAVLLTVPARPAIDGPTPLGLLEASQRGSGKTLLADLIAVIVTGAQAPRRVAPKTKEEWDKTLLSILLAGDPLVLFDNVTNMLTSDALDAVLTGTVYTQRLLGVSEDRRVKIRTVFVVSANNARLSTDLVRRSVACRLEPDVERPELRGGFRHEDLLGHVGQHRAKYLGAVLTILRAYAVAGRPPVKSRRMGSYHAWSRIVRDALVWAGAPDPAITQDALRESADVETDELRDLLTAWHEAIGDQHVTAKELVECSQKGGAGELADALEGIVPNGKMVNARSVGYQLRSLRGQIVGGVVLRERKRRAQGHAKEYWVAKL